jgi:hypothetical protein
MCDACCQAVVQAALAAAMAARDREQVRRLIAERAALLAAS